MDKEKKLQKLTEFWYDYVGCDHHKDRDCHFYVNKVWSYGREPYYRPEHYPYMGGDFSLDGEFETYKEALDVLVEYLEEEVKAAYKIPRDWEDQTKHDYNWKGVVEVLNNYKLHEIEYR